MQRGLIGECALLMENSQAEEMFALIYEPFGFVYKRVSAAIKQATLSPDINGDDPPKLISSVRIASLEFAC